MRILGIIALLNFLYFHTYTQPLSRSFEHRYITNDQQANGITDFKGENEWMNTQQRIDFLESYATVASGFLGNPRFDQKIATQIEIDSLLTRIKPQPTTSVRKTIQLDNWKAYGYHEGQDIEKQKELESYSNYPGVIVQDGDLVIENSTLNKDISSLAWRFKVEVSIKTDGNSRCFIHLYSDNKQAISFGTGNGNLFYGTNGKLKKTQIRNPKGYLKLTIEADLEHRRFNLYSGNERIRYFIPIMDTTAATLTKFSITSEGTSRIGNIFIFNHTPTEEARYPYISKVVMDEDFNHKPSVNAWQATKFDDSTWDTVTLPSAHGGVREKSEAYYLRKKIKVGGFRKAFLKFEAIDPGGEVWVNGRVVSVINTRHPVELNVSEFLVCDRENLIAVKVNPYKLHFPMPHTPTDHHIGWFLGRASLVLTQECRISNVLVHTSEIGNPAIQTHNVSIQCFSRDYFNGSVEINYYPWFPEEGNKVVSLHQEINIPPRINSSNIIDCSIPTPELWSYDHPNLYKVEVVLYNSKGETIDDFVTTTGIRTVEQGEGSFYINGEVEMLNGAQIMGFRTPIETVAKHNRCAPRETVAEELLMVKKMGANMLRVHVHAEKDTTDGINDPRYAEFADQMGIMLIWQTSGFIREGEAWNVDFEGYPKFMKQVYNHPSIVIWEASNHPNRFKEHDISDTHNYIKKIYHTIHSTDSNRLFSPTTFWPHTHYGNSEGTIDYEGNPIVAVPEFTAPEVTRGNQDSYTGYGKEWSDLRNLPYEWAKTGLKDKERAYFNFEHEESIGQPNWNLCKGKPWYLLQSYEWVYDEGSIGRKLTTSEWKISQAWQAFSAWESMKKQMLIGYDGFSWCCLRGGANMGTYKKPLIDNLGHPKLAYYTNKMAFQRTWAGSNNVDVVYGPGDTVNPVIHHIGQSRKVNLVLTLVNSVGQLIDKKKFNQIELGHGRDIKELDGFKFKKSKDGVYTILYEIYETKK